ncbi:MAG: acetyltransferase [Bacillaceae bacterium]|nr:acetyltransferase [Bacillaceae bacterium]
MRNVVIIGQGGHSKVIQDIILAKEELRVVGFLDDKFVTSSIESGFFYGPISAINDLLEWNQDAYFVIGIGNNHVRKLVYEKLQLPDVKYITLVHPTAVVSRSAKIGYGTVVMANAVINSDVTVGNHVIINTGAIVEHDNDLADYVHISPNATLTGAVHVEEGSHICAGATIIPNITIGEWSTIGAGATVIHHIPAKCTAVGIPAVVKSREGERVG